MKENIRCNPLWLCRMFCCNRKETCTPNDIQISHRQIKIFRDRFGGLLHAVVDPPLNSFNKSCCDVVYPKTVWQFFAFSRVKQRHLPFIKPFYDASCRFLLLLFRTSLLPRGTSGSTDPFLRRSAARSRRFPASFRPRRIRGFHYSVCTRR